MFTIFDTLAYQNGLVVHVLRGAEERYIEHSRGWTHKEEIDNRNETLFYLLLQTSVYEGKFLIVH